MLELDDIVFARLDHTSHSKKTSGIRGSEGEIAGMAAEQLGGHPEERPKRSRPATPECFRG